MKSMAENLTEVIKLCRVEEESQVCFVSYKMCRKGIEHAHA